MKSEIIAEKYGTDFLQYLLIVFPEYIYWSDDEIKKHYEFYLRTEFITQ